MTKAPLQPQDKYVLRFPEGMRGMLKAAAETNNRSMNAEIVARLERSFSPWPFMSEVDGFDLAIELLQLSKGIYENGALAAEQRLEVLEMIGTARECFLKLHPNSPGDEVAAARDALSVLLDKMHRYFVRNEPLLGEDVAIKLRSTAQRLSSVNNVDS